MPVGLMGVGAAGSGGVQYNSRTNSATPGHLTELVPPVPTPQQIAAAMKIGGSRPNWDNYGVIYNYLVVNPPTGTEATAVGTSLRLFVRTNTAGSVVVFGKP